MNKILTTLAKNNDDSTKIRAYFKLPAHDVLRLPVWLENRVTSEVRGNRLRFTITPFARPKIDAMPNQVILQGTREFCSLISEREFNLNWTPIGIDNSIPPLDPTQVNEEIDKLLTRETPTVEGHEVEVPVADWTPATLERSVIRSMRGYPEISDSSPLESDSVDEEEITAINAAIDRIVDSSSKQVALDSITRLPDDFVPVYDSETVIEERPETIIRLEPTEKPTVTLALDLFLDSISATELLKYVKTRLTKDWNKQFHAGYRLGREDMYEEIQNEIQDIFAKGYEPKATE